MTRLPTGTIIAEDWSFVPDSENASVANALPDPAAASLKPEHISPLSHNADRSRLPSATEGSALPVEKASR